MLRGTDHGDAASRQPTGRFLSTCTALFQTEVKCAGSLLLRDGTIELAGTPDFAADTPIVAPVTGGTGRYAGADGTATITATDMEGPADHRSRRAVRSHRAPRDPQDRVDGRRPQRRARADPGDRCRALAGYGA